MWKIGKVLYYFRVLINSLYINFKCLPLSKAVKLPILCYKPTFRSLKGYINIESENVSFGMIRLGFLTSVLYPNSGIMLKNDGSIVFKGKCVIGNDCSIVCEKSGRVEFGENFRVTAGLKMVSVKEIKFDKDVLVGWGNIIIDTNFHPLYDMIQEKAKRVSAKISIGTDNWLAAKCVVLPGISTPPLHFWYRYNPYKRKPL